MNKHLTALSFIFICLLSLELQAQKVKGNGNVVTQERNTGSFNEIHTQGSFNINITDGNDHRVSVEAEENLQSFIIVESNGNKLQIRHKKGEDFRATKDITIHITAPALAEISLSGSGNVKSTNQISGSDKLNIKTSGSGNITLDVETSNLMAGISGSGNITLQGKTNDLDANISGSGNIKAKNLQSENTSIKISGSGSAEVVANQTLDSRIAGSGDVKYWGNASVNSKIAGSGSVRKEK